jgi:hypothetical protein
MVGTRGKGEVSTGTDPPQIERRGEVPNLAKPR